jgi:uncharacterized protein (DUF3084 family)
MTDASPDTFAAALALLAAAADVPGTKARLAELAKQIAAAEKAHAALTADRETHHRELAAAQAATNAREAKLRDREVKVGIAERDIAAREKVIADARPPRFSYDPNLGPGGRSYSGLTREAS